jgi:hypothetical protein
LNSIDCSTLCLPYQLGRSFLRFQVLERGPQRWRAIYDRGPESIVLSAPSMCSDRGFVWLAQLRRLVRARLATRDPAIFIDFVEAGNHLSYGLAGTNICSRCYQTTVVTAEVPIIRRAWNSADRVYIGAWELTSTFVGSCRWVPHSRKATSHY